jgi:hypothetical protein
MIYLGNSAEIEDIKKKYIAFLEKIKPYFEKYGYTYDERWDGFTNNPETNDGLFRYGSQMDITHWSDYVLLLDYRTLKCTYLPNGKTSVSTVNTEIQYNLNDEFDYETLEKWLESQKEVINQVLLYGKKKKVEKKMKSLEKDFEK